MLSPHKTRSPDVAEIATRTVWNSHDQHADHGYFRRGNFGGSLIRNVF